MWRSPSSFAYCSACTGQTRNTRTSCTREEAAEVEAEVAAAVGSRHYPRRRGAAGAVAEVEAEAEVEPRPAWHRSRRPREGEAFSSSAEGRTRRARIDRRRRPLLPDSRRVPTNRREPTRR